MANALSRSESRGLVENDKLATNLHFLDLWDQFFVVDPALIVIENGYAIFDHHLDDPVRSGTRADLSLVD